MTLFKLGHVVGEDGADGADGAPGAKGDKGDTGATGNGIQSIVLKSTTGKKKTYRITFTNGTTFDYDVYDGEDGSSATVDIVTSWNSTLSDEKVPSEKLSKNSLDGKAPTSHASSANTYGLGSTSNYGHVKTVNGLTQSSHSDGTALSAYQGKVLKDAIDAKPDSSDIPTKTSDLTNDSNYISTSTTSGLIKNDGTIDTTSYSTFSGSYNDLSNKPTIPSKISDLTNDSDFIEKSSTSGLVKNDGTIDTSAYITSASLPVIQTSWGSTTSDEKVASEKLVKTSLDDKLPSHLGSQAQKPLITGSDGAIQLGSFGTSSGTFAEGNHTHSNYISTSSTQGLIKNDGTIDTNSYLTSSALSNYVQKSNTSGLLKNDGSVMTSGTGASNYSAGNHTHSGYASSTHTHVSVDVLSGEDLHNIGTTEDDSQFEINTAIDSIIGQINSALASKLSATKVTSWQSTPSDSNVPSEKLVSDTFDAIEDLIGDAIQYINQ